MIRRHLNYRLAKWLLAVGLLATVLVLTGYGCDTTPTPTLNEPLTVQIDLPEDKAEFSVNIQKVSGAVSDPEAGVQVNDVDVEVNQDGTFYIYVELSKGENIIEAIATRGDDTYSDSITVTFIPALAVYVTNLAFEPGVDYSISPVTVTGWVSNDEAAVSVNGNQAQVAEDGHFSVNVQLQEGANTVEAIATLDGKTDRWSWGYRITHGTFGPPATGPSYQNVSSLDWPKDDIQLKAGETKLLNFTWMTGKRHGRSISEMFYYELSENRESSSQAIIPIPEGLEISLEPSGFILFSNTTYHFTITITAAPDLPPIPYYIDFKLDYGEGYWKPGLTINVEEGSLNMWLIIGSVLGVLVIGCVVYYFMRRRS